MMMFFFSSSGNRMRGRCGNSFRFPAVMVTAIYPANGQTTRVIFLCGGCALLFRITSERNSDTQEAIVSKEQWDIVQELRQNRRRLTKAGRQSLFSGLVYCADCGKKMRFMTYQGCTEA